MARVASAVLIAAYESGQSLEEIATAWRVSRNGVKARLLRANVVLRPRGRPRSARVELLRALLDMKKEMTS